MTAISLTDGDDAGSPELALVLPRVLIVSRRTVRKNKFVDFVGEYHLDLIVSYGAVPVIVPRVSGLNTLLDSFEPIHGVLLCEGEDIDPMHYESDLSSLTLEQRERIKLSHSSDTTIDKVKDSIELQLARRCLERNIPYLGICRGSQVLNVACGGSLYQDVETELSSKVGVHIRHINYDNYDGHRHPVQVVQGTPLHEWFEKSLREGPHEDELVVNSYHHQGVKRLAERFVPMAFAPDGLVEAFYDPDVYHPEEGKFIVGLQFHPERMRHDHAQDTYLTDHDHSSSESILDYPECHRAYQEFVRAVIAYQKRLFVSGKENVVPKQDQAKVERKRRALVRSFSIAKLMYEEQDHLRKSGSSHGETQALTAVQQAESESQEYLELGAKFLQSTTVLTALQVKRLHQMGATVRNSTLLAEKMKRNADNEKEARQIMEEMGVEELQDCIEMYRMMVNVASEVLKEKCSFSEK